MDTAPLTPDSLSQMAEEIFALSVQSWRQRIASRHGDAAADLTESQFLTLDCLVQATTTQTVGEIQRSIGVLPAQMSRIIRSLESGFPKPLIHCVLNTVDKRKIDVTITSQGKKLYDEFRNARLSKTLDILQHLTDHDRLEFVRICRQIRKAQDTPQT